MTNARSPDPPLHRLAGPIDSLEFWLVPGLAAAAIADARLLLPALVIAALFWPLRKLVTGVWTHRTPVDLPVALILVSAVVSLLVSALPAVTSPQVLRLLGGIALCYAIVNRVRSQGRVRLIASGIVLGGIALGVIAFFTVDWTDAKFPFIPEVVYSRIPTLVSDVVHPNVLGGTLLLAAPVSAALFLWGSPGDRWLRWLGGAAFVWIAAVLVLSQSRGALLGLAGGLLLLVVLRWRWGWLGLVAAGLAAAWAFSYFGTYSLGDLLFGSGVFGGIRGRLEIWGRGIFMLQDFPFTGIGMGLFPEVVSRIYPFFSPSEVTVLHAHNLFIQVGVDLGLPGLAAWLAVFGTVGWCGWVLARRGGRLAGLGAGVLAVQVALAIHGLFDAVVWGQVRSAPLVWAVWGFGLALWNLQAENPARPDPAA
jgi:putative inorganic carbon (HCO3(-)) transporter